MIISENNTHKNKLLKMSVELSEVSCIEFKRTDETRLLPRLLLFVLGGGGVACVLSYIKLSLRQMKVWHRSIK